MNDQKANNIKNVDFGSAISERYLSYALSTIMSRSLPDVRDGLKPVHRRILYAMLKLRLDPSSAYKKCARVVGDVIGKYHPHGDVAVYDTLVRLAQDFSLRYPLIEGQGNFGSIDGDSAAAMRYTESRMTDICMLLMEDIDKNTVDFKSTYDDSDSEPTLMPARFPNLLANGSEGIAVGMATSIPPHNLHELCDALIYMIDHKGKAEISELMQFIKGPDFPTGGIIVDNQSVIMQAYMTGRGSFRVRAKWEKENLSHGLYQIIITEIPYQVQKSRLIEQIANLFKDKKIPLVSNIRDESTDQIRVIIEPKGRSCDPEMVMESLFRLSDLEVKIHLNLNVLQSSNVPKVLNIGEVLQEFLNHREIIVTKRTEYLIHKIEERLEILEALKVAYLNIDEVIRIIREEDNPKQEMISKFKITDNQAEAILNIKLRALRKLEEFQINKEHDELTTQHKALSAILGDKKKLWSLIKNELLEVQKNFGQNTAIGARRTIFEESTNRAQIIDISAFVEKEPITIICSKMGWIKAQKGHNLDLTNIKYKEGDECQFILEANTTDNIIICGSNGKFFTILGDNIPKGKGHGESIKLMVDIENNDITNIIPYKSGEKFILASDSGKGFIVSSDDVIAQTKNGKQIMQLPNESKCVKCKPIIKENALAVVGTNRKLVVFDLSEIPEMKRGQGVCLQKYREAKLSDLKLFDTNIGLSWVLGNKQRLESDIMSWRTRRGGVGKIPPVGFPKNNKFE